MSWNYSRNIILILILPASFYFLKNVMTRTFKIITADEFFWFTLYFGWTVVFYIFFLWLYIKLFSLFTMLQVTGFLWDPWICQAHSCLGVFVYFVPLAWNVIPLKFPLFFFIIHTSAQMSLLRQAWICPWSQYWCCHQWLLTAATSGSCSQGKLTLWHRTFSLFSTRYHK